MSLGVHVIDIYVIPLGRAAPPCLHVIIIIIIKLYSPFSVM